MARIYRTTNLDARALVADDGRAYQLSSRRRGWLQEQHAADLAASRAEQPPPGEPFTLSGQEPIIDCIRKLDDGSGYLVTTGDFRETELSPEQFHELLDD